MLETRAGYIGSSEVVEVWFDPQAMSFADLLAHAESHACADAVFATSAQQLASARAAVGTRARELAAPVRPDPESKYYLRQTALRHIAMTPAQAARVNAHVRGGDHLAFLSPRQRQWLASLADTETPDLPVAIDQPITDAWDALARRLASRQRSDRQKAKSR